MKTAADLAKTDAALTAAAAKAQTLVTQADTDLATAQKMVTDQTAASQKTDAALVQAQQMATAAAATADAARRSWPRWTPPWRPPRRKQRPTRPRPTMPRPRPCWRRWPRWSRRWRPFSRRPRSERLPARPGVCLPRGGAWQASQSVSLAGQTGSAGVPELRACQPAGCSGAGRQGRKPEATLLWNEQQPLAVKVVTVLTVVVALPSLGIGNHPKRVWLAQRSVWFLGSLSSSRQAKDDFRFPERANSGTDFDRREGQISVGGTAANAAAGNFPEAVKWQKKAIELGFDDQARTEKARQRLKLYEKNTTVQRRVKRGSFTSFDRNQDCLSILAEPLEDAGCKDQEILRLYPK